MEKEMSDESNILKYTEFHKLRLSFIRGILYFFGLDKNPVQRILDEYKAKTDADRLAEDWRKVGEDIRKVYGKETKNIR
jgi:hypothetical protein